ncbi:hypothetical protein H4582DRAFT_2024795 [Lactarius indigo]|nr:hypothetical protein H4582DRAFT_2024795 [Lactarius indigo]
MGGRTKKKKERKAPYNLGSRLQNLLKASRSRKVGPFHRRIVIIENEPIFVNIIFGTTPPPLYDFIIVLGVLYHAVREGRISEWRELGSRMDVDTLMRTGVSSENHERKSSWLPVTARQADQVLHKANSMPAEGSSKRGRRYRYMCHPSRNVGAFQKNRRTPSYCNGWYPIIRQGGQACQACQA